MSKNTVLSFRALFFSGAYTSKPSSSVSVEDDFLPVEEAFKDTDSTSNLKDYDKSLLLSDTVKDVEYVKLETQDTILVGNINQSEWTEKLVFIYSRRQNHVMMFDTAGKFIRKIDRVGQDPGEIANIHRFTVSDSLVPIYPYSCNGSLTTYDIRDNSFVKELFLKWPIILRWIIDVIGDCLAYCPDTVYLPNNGRIFINACIVNEEGETSTEQIPYLTTDARESLNLDPNPSWLYRGRSNVYSFTNDAIYGIICDSTFPRYHLSLEKYKLLSGRYDPTRDYG